MWILHVLWHHNSHAQSAVDWYSLPYLLHLFREYQGQEHLLFFVQFSIVFIAHADTSCSLWKSLNIQKKHIQILKDSGVSQLSLSSEVSHAKLCRNDNNIKM